MLAAGENAFKSPEITIWKLDYNEERQVTKYDEIKHLRGHKFGIECLKFAPKNNFLISLGDPQDKGLFVWNWQEESKITKNLLSKPVLTVAISED